MNDWARELGQTVRAAMKSWPETARLCVLIAATESVNQSGALLARFY
jgi:hypothetical protein